MSNKADVFFLLHLSQVKKTYLESCIAEGNDPDINFLQILQLSEASINNYQRLDLTTTVDLPNILRLLENETHVQLLELKHSQFQKYRQSLQEFSVRNPKIEIKINKTQLTDNLKHKQPIPALDLNQIQSTSKSSVKSNRQYSSHSKNYSCKNMKNLQQFFTDRISGHLSSSKETDRKTSSISPNTKTINLNLITKNPLNQVLSTSHIVQNFAKKSFFSSKKKEPFFIDFLGKSEFQTSRNYLKKTSSNVFNKTSSITVDTERSKQTIKQQAGSFIQLNDQLKNNVSKEQDTGILKQECKSMHIPVKYLLESNPPLMKVDSDRFKLHLSNRENSKDFKKDKLESSREHSFKKQLNILVQNSDKNGYLVQKQSHEIVENEDISVHLKNLINFCNQSIQKKESVVHDSQEMPKKYLISQKENIEKGKKLQSGKMIGSVEIKTLNLKSEEDPSDNPETARFNQEESDLKKLNDCINQKKNGHQTDRLEPYFPMEQLSELKNIYSSRGLQKLFEQKSKSVSPTNQDQKQNSFFNTTSNDLVGQLMSYKTKRDLKGKTIKISSIQIQNTVFDKQTEKGIKEICQQIQVSIFLDNIFQGLKIDKETSEQFSLPLMKALFHQHLQYLSLANCNIAQNDLTLSLVFLEYIDISGNKLSNLSIVKNCTNLLELQATSNQIANLDGLQLLKSLKIVDLQANKIHSFETLLIFKKNENIVTVNFLGNAVAKYPNYKRFLQQILPKLQHIDQIDYVTICTLLIFSLKLTNIFIQTKRSINATASTKNINNK